MKKYSMYLIRFRVIFLTIIYFESVSPVMTQQKTQNFISLGTGATIPVQGDTFKGRYNVGYNVEAKFGLDLGRYYKLRIGFQHSEFSSKDESSMKLSITNIGGEFLFNDVFRYNVNMYPKFGAYYYLLNSDDVSENVLGISAGAGINYSISKSKRTFISIETGFHYFFNTNEVSKKFISDARMMVPVSAMITFLL